MAFPEVIFEIVEDRRCPYYSLGDRIRLSGKALLLEQNNEKTFLSTTVIRFPVGKSACQILIEDISEMLVRYKSIERVPGYTIRCSGCTGMIQMAYRRESRRLIPENDLRSADDIDMIQKLLSNFSFFQVLDEYNLKDFIPLLRLKEYDPGDIIMRRGRTGKNLFIIVSGQVEVVGAENISIAFMGKGEVFGEMSLLSGDLVTATVRAVEPTRVLYMKGDDFKKLLSQSSGLQLYFTRLLSRRLAQVNVLRSEEFSSGVVGQLSEMPPLELFQIFNINQKTGILTLMLAKGPGRILFRDGRLIGAIYNGKEGREAFYEVLKVREGRFRFIQGLPPEEENAMEIGDFNWLLMDALRRIDEEKEDRTQETAPDSQHEQK